MDSVCRSREGQEKATEKKQTKKPPWSNEQISLSLFWVSLITLVIEMITYKLQLLGVT